MEEQTCGGANKNNALIMSSSKMQSRSRVVQFLGDEMRRKLRHVLALLRPCNSCGAVTLVATLTIFSPTWLAAQSPLAKPPDHIVIVVEENRSYKRIMDFVKDHPDSYLASLISQGASFSSFFALHHPSQPNYVLFFSGDTQGIVNDKKPPNLISHLKATSIAGELRRKRLTFTGYAEDLPKPGFDGDKSGDYARKHCPWINFADVPTFWSLPLTKFPKNSDDFGSLPTVSFVIPNQKNDMHGENPIAVLGGKLFPKLIKDADIWLEKGRNEDWKGIKSYADWAMTHNSLLIVTWDEDDSARYQLCFTKKCKEKHGTTQPPKTNRIVTIFVGQMVQPGKVSDIQYTHLDLLRTLEEMYGLPLLGATGNPEVRSISDIWK